MMLILFIFVLPPEVISALGFSSSSSRLPCMTTACLASLNPSSMTQ
eukprot:CAMPEP_0182498898 /NCGR_PEP_ID=MMETSP1321-20130603/6955_1 /TAXON_ID=91990 /ORGANISM="Bolidomonas sp., Strain RCC1657" /LENGTH=45 /DNA_ID= /DNA_START= /DNA_END= /DNA_ORIENTATION=